VTISEHPRVPRTSNSMQINRVVLPADHTDVNDGDRSPSQVHIRISDNVTAGPSLASGSPTTDYTLHGAPINAPPGHVIDRSHHLQTSRTGQQAVDWPSPGFQSFDNELADWVQGYVHFGWSDWIPTVNT
jgi:hypothetical protein